MADSTVDDQGRRFVGGNRAGSRRVVPPMSRIAVRPLSRLVTPRRARVLGIPTVVLTAATGTALFATLTKDQASQTLRLVLGLVSVLAAVLAALQTFLGYGQRADKHRTTAAAYGSIRREIEQYQALGPSSRDELERMMAKLRSRLDEVSRSAPDVPHRSWAKAQPDIAGTDRPEGSRRSGATSK